MNNQGCAVHPMTTIAEYEELCSLLQIQIGAAMVNSGSDQLGAGMILNDNFCFVGMNSTSIEMDNLRKIFKINSTF